jgi:hypothetical protein
MAEAMAKSGVGDAGSASMRKPSSNFGTPDDPMTSVATVRSRRASISICSFQSASTCTRPCCILTLL